jgi:hypothetical protein
MNKQSSKAVIVALLDACLAVNDLLVLHDIVVFKYRTSSCDQMLSFTIFVLGLLSHEFLFFVFLLSEASLYDRLNTEHERDRDDH